MAGNRYKLAIYNIVDKLEAINYVNNLGLGIFLHGTLFTDRIPNDFLGFGNSNCLYVRDDGRIFKNGLFWTEEQFFDDLKKSGDIVDRIIDASKLKNRNDG